MKEIKKMLSVVAEKYNLDLCKEEAIKNGNEKYLEVEFAACYGGYRLVMVAVSGGGHYGAFGESSCVSRRSKKEMIAYMEGLINSL